MQHVEQREEALVVLVGDDDDDHPVAKAAVADDEVAKESRMVADVVVFELVLLGVAADGEADVVAGVALQGAVADVEHLVEELGDMEPEGPGTGFWLGVFVGLGGAPGFGGEGEFQLVAVVLDIVGAADGAHAGAVDVAEPLEVVAHLALLGVELR